MGKNYLLSLCLFSVCALSAQTEYVPVESENIIPNASFEELTSHPIGWFYKGQHFTEVMKYWSAATMASPDVFGPEVRVPMSWAEKDFGKQTARTGEAMAGITVFGCDEGKPHCREYIQIQLSEPLVVGQHYYLEFWVSHLPRSLQVNSLGAHFSLTRTDVITDRVLELSPQVWAENILDASDHRWVPVAGSFTAETEAEYLVIGNFFPDSLTQSRSVCEDHYKYAYYYVDDVLLRKEEPILPVPLKEDDLTLIPMEAGQTIRLKDIYFETDKAELMPRSFVELRKLVKIMQENPSMVIEIHGHTDSRGGDEYNLDLSERRARSVVRFLNRSGVAPERTRYKGFGSTRPIASNASDDGRQLNRRVEFFIVRK